MSEPGSPASKQVLIRATQFDHDRWKEAADRLGMNLSEYIRSTLNEKTADLIDCLHPLNMRRYYPWSEFCLKCGQRLRG